ncbi:MAG: LptF/LptG family permease [Holosporales bacterium]|jgi:lipopolysaccharide export system permease protein|nr:LptF/LptG family permease [Holosporales bacterium]
MGKRVILPWYIVKNQAKMLLLITFIVSIMVFLTDFIETIRVETTRQHTVFTIFHKSLFKFPYIVFNVYPYIFLGACGVTLRDLAKSHQITILKAIGFKDVNILQPIISFSFFIGVLWLTVLHPVACKMYLKVMNPDLIEKMCSQKSKMENVWLHQHNESEEILIHADEICNRIAKNISIYSLDKKGAVRKKIIALSANISDTGFILHSGISSSSSNEDVERFPEMTFASSISSEHFISEFKQPEFMGIYELLELLKLRTDANLDYHNAVLQINILLTTVLMTAIMPLVAAIPCMVNRRHYKGIYVFFFLTVGSVFMYFALNVLRTLSYGHFAALSIWFPVLLIGFVSFCLVKLKERNYAFFT